MRNGIFVKTRYLSNPLRYEYKLTKKGYDILPTILAAITWENKWHLNADKPFISLRHEVCGHICDVSVVCAECGEEIKSEDIKYIDVRKLKAKDKAQLKANKSAKKTVKPAK